MAKEKENLILQARKRFQITRSVICILRTIERWDSSQTVAAIITKGDSPE